MSGVIPSREFNDQLVELVKRDRRTHGNKIVDTDYDNQQRLLSSRFPERCVILNSALPAATNSKTGATSGMATICRWSMENEEYTETEQQIKVWNHSEATGHAVDTFGTARFINGHYWFFGDCDAMVARNPPEEDA